MYKTIHLLPPIVRVWNPLIEPNKSTLPKKELPTPSQY